MSFGTSFQLTKPGIIFGNTVTAASGFALASKGHFNPGLFLAMLIGLSLIIASGCVFNNYIDRGADEKMVRTKNRALVQKLISVKNALIFASILVICGTFVLILYTNRLSVAAALMGFFIYVILYSFGKYRTPHATVIGSIAGGMPPVVGYCAVSHSFDAGALILFMIIALWQMPHFFSIAMVRLEEYAAASIPVLPVKRGIRITKIQILLYTIAFTISALMLTVCGYTGYAYLIAAALLGAAWLTLCIQGFKSTNDKAWARKMFLFSLIAVMVLCLMISIDRN